MKRRQAVNLISVGLLLAMAASAGPAAAFQAGYRNAPAGWHLAAQQRDIPWDSLSREEKKLLKKHKGSWAGYPPEKQQQYERLSPRERQQLRDEYRRQQR
jgi:hypothetical protein